MYTLLLIGCILALTLSPLLLDAILVWKETRPQRQLHGAPTAAGLTLMTPRLH